MKRTRKNDPTKKWMPNPAGRPKGIPNKSTTLAREAIARFIDDNASRLQGWLDDIAEENPLAAFNAVRDLMEYHLPKIARVEHTGKDGDAININGQIDVTQKILDRLPQEELERILQSAKNADNS